MPTLDPRNPMVVDVRALGRGAGSLLALDRVAPAPADLGAGTAWVSPGSPVILRLRLESVIEGVLVSGTATATVGAECARCLDPTAWDETVSLAELYLYEPGPPDEDLPLLDGDRFDLLPTLRDTLVLALPLAPLCRSDCPGLCPECGVHLAEEPDHSHNTIDPRWARLSAIHTD